MELDFSREYVLKSGIYDFLGGSELKEFEKSGVNLELDYAWNYETDPLITKTIIHEWKYLDLQVSRYVFSGAKSILSIGGGGSSRTHEYLSVETNEFAVLNTGIWDLENAKLPKSDITTYLIRSIAEDLPIFDSQFSAIEITATLDHVMDPKKVIEESYRVLRNGGLLGITLGNSHSWYRKVISFLRVQIRDNHGHNHNFHFTVGDIETLLLNAGFKDIKTVGTAYLKLPRAIDKRVNKPILLSIHRFISNSVLKRIFGNKNGGMFLIYATKPS
ncbi:MAG: methyltransferase domain-containing protein [Betaproteobacteria bacterium]|nr:methyltransferase domain-containing protein [Betaproteobacteria bacterium]